jgi:hypothetical protein
LKAFAPDSVHRVLADYCTCWTTGPVRCSTAHIRQQSLDPTSPLLLDALQVDVYSYGIVLWELWTGREPFEGLNYHALLHQMTSAGEAMRPPLPGSADWDAAQVCRAVHVLQRDACQYTAQCR